MSIVEKGIKDNLRWFYEAKFGMFIHFGLYSLLGRGEWVMYDENIPVETYEQLMCNFNPERFEADEWVRLASDAGARYITVTAKHHDGFCLYDSSLTDYKITNTPFQRDLAGELIDACHRHGMRINLYYSQPDWHHPNFEHRPGAFKDLANPSEYYKPDWGNYLDYYFGQVEELCTKYGRIDGIWFDGSHKTVDDWKGREIYALIKKHQPDAVVNDRAGFGDYFTPERDLPDDLSGYMFEACESISPTAWGYQNDMAAFSVPHLVKSMLKMVASGGNYLLNIGPKPDGTIPDKQVQIMREIGKWLKSNGKSIYGAEPVCMDHSGNQFAFTRKDNRLFMHCMEWPASDRITIPGIAGKVKGITMLGSMQKTNYRDYDMGLEIIDLPAVPPDSLPQTFEMEFDGAMTVREKETICPEKPSVKLKHKGFTYFGADTAEILGRGVKGARLKVFSDYDTGKRYIGDWNSREQGLLWKGVCRKEGAYDVVLSAACPRGLGGWSAKVSVGSFELSAEIPESSVQCQLHCGRDGHKAKFESIQLGTVILAEGNFTVTLRAEKLKWGYLFGRIEGLAFHKSTV